MKNKFWASVLILFVLITVAACSQTTQQPIEKEEDSGAEEDVSKASSIEETELAYNPPKMEELEGKNDPLSESIKYGHELFVNTNTVADDYVGNELSCLSCHAGAGYGKESSLVGVTTQFPQYRPREGVVFTIEDRINGCMVRSMNGEKFPYDSEEMRGMVAYLTYLSEGIPVGAEIPWRMLNTLEDVPEPNITNGEEIYNKSCLSCHGENGEGIGANTGPAVWGPNSFNDGAGMARISKAAGFIQRNMPIGQEETLTDQQAADVAAFILSHDRPKWEGRANDWPKGGAPKDVPYYDEINSVIDEANSVEK